MAEVSIIIPVFNVAPYLEECLDSCVNQTFRDIEIICINDGSTDNSLNILNEYASNDARIIVLSQENQGQGVARNKGIDKASGRYLMFVDPDDFIELNTVETVYKNFLENEVEIIQYNYGSFEEDGSFRYTKYFSKRMKKYFHHKIKDKTVFNWHQIKTKSLQDMSMCVWDKAYSSKLIKENNIQLAPFKLGEDHIFSIAAQLLANKILYIDKSFYHYRNRAGSAANKASDDYFCVFESIKLIKNFIEENGFYDEYKSALSVYIATVAAWHYTRIPSVSSEKYLKQCREVLSEKEYKLFKRKIKGNYSFVEQIFSLKNKKVYGIKHKYITIFGMTFQLSDRGM